MELQGFYRAQKLAYDAILETKSLVAPGMTEIEAARILGDRLRAHGADDWFHTPLAWFGDRTRFDRMHGFKDYLPSTRVLSVSDVVILDAAPLVDGYIGDVGYTYALQPNPELVRAQATLLDLRRVLPEWFERAPNLGQVWKQVEEFLAARDYDNCYRLYPFSVLGHRVGRVRMHANWGRGRLSLPVSYLSWFGLSAYRFFLSGGGITGKLLRTRSRQNKDGVWAIEPHLGAAGFGAKFEEILVMEGGKARWLTDDVPHFAKTAH